MGEEEAAWLVNRKHEAATMTEAKIYENEMKMKIYEMLKKFSFTIGINNLKDSQ